MTCKLSEVISPAFYDVHRAVKAGDINEIVEKGGRGSAKSSHISVEVPLLIIKHPNIHAAVFRKVGNTLRNSVFAQYCWAISALGLSEQFRCTVSPMEITYLPTGQKIMFFGLDDPGKAKSIKVPFGYIGVAHFEELDQFAGPEEVRNVEQSIFRGGPFSLCFKSFNPPAMAKNWANRYALEEKPGKLIHHSTYLTTPESWLGPKFLSDAAYLQEAKPTEYRHEYLGEVVGSGTQVFENIRLEAISEEKISYFDRKLHGVDWGWYPDPWAYTACNYDAGSGTLYIFDELTRWKTSNRETAELLLARGIVSEDAVYTADSSEEKSCGDYRAYGLPFRGAVKGPGSVRAGTQWLQSLCAIVIDPTRCPDTAREFSEYEYERNRRTGDVQEGYPDINNHHIDGVRYATERIWRRRGK